MKKVFTTILSILSMMTTIDFVLADPDCGQGCIPHVLVNIKPLGYEAGRNVTIFETWMSY